MKALLLKAVEALTLVSNYASRQACAHDDTYRGGAIWEICRDCGAKWADDEGGRPPYVEPHELIAASEAIADLEAAIKKQPGEAVAVFDDLIAFAETSVAKPTFADAVDIALKAKQRSAVAPLKDEGEARKGAIANLPENPRSVAEVKAGGWQLHRCGDGERCRASIPGGCASGWCAHFLVRPDDEGVPRFPPAALSGKAQP